MKDKQLKQVDLIRIAQERQIKLGKSHISQYVSGKTVPRADMLAFLSEVLEVKGRECGKGKCCHIGKTGCHIGETGCRIGETGRHIGEIR